VERKHRKDFTKKGLLGIMDSMKAAGDIRKVLNRPLVKENGSPWPVNFIAGVEVVLALAGFVALWLRPVDWEVFWPDRLLNFKEAMPWGHWLALDLVSLAVFYHGLAASMRKRWALVGIGLIGIVALWGSALVIYARATDGVPKDVPLMKVISSWSTTIGWMYFYGVAVKEGYKALRGTPRTKTTAKQNASPPIQLA
jgi:hypothetical protein